MNLFVLVPAIYLLACLSLVFVKRRKTLLALRWIVFIGVIISAVLLTCGAGIGLLFTHSIGFVYLLKTVGIGVIIFGALYGLMWVPFKIRETTL